MRIETSGPTPKSAIQDLQSELLNRIGTAMIRGSAQRIIDTITYPEQYRDFPVDVGVGWSIVRNMGRAKKALGSRNQYDPQLMNLNEEWAQLRLWLIDQQSADAAAKDT